MRARNVRFFILLDLDQTAGRDYGAAQVRGARGGEGAGFEAGALYRGGARAARRNDRRGTRRACRARPRF